MTKNKNKLTALEIGTYALGALGSAFGASCVNTFILIYFCVYQGLNPMIITVAFVLAKLWDAINDPMLATLVNNTRETKFGRYKPWIFFGALVNAASLALIYIDIGDVGIFWKYVYYIFMYVVWGMSYTCVDVPFWSTLPTIADTTHERNSASGIAKLVGGFGGFMTGLVGTSIVLPNFSGDGIKKAYALIGVICGLIMIVFLSVTVLFNKERYKVPHENLKFRELFNMFKTNDQLRAYASSYIFYNIGYSIATAQLLYVYIYSYDTGMNLLDKNYSYTLFWVVACTGQGFAMMFYNLITKKFPRERLYGWAYTATIVSFVLLFAVFFFLKEGQYLLNSILVGLAGAAMMLSAGINQIGSTVMIADVVDYGEWKTGKRGDSIIFSVQTLLVKFAGAIAMFILGIGIAVAGLPTVTDLPITDLDGSYAGTVSVFTDKETGKYLINEDEVWEKIQTNPEYVKNAEKIGEDEEIVSSKGMTILRFFMFIVPIPLLYYGYVVYKKHYNLYGEKYDNIKKEIDERRRKEEEEKEKVKA